MEFNYNDGGRSKYFKADNVGDCVTRAIAIATGKDYLEIYNRLNEMAKRESTKRHRGHKRSQARNGVFKETWKRYLKEIGWVHHSTCEVGSRNEKLKFVDGALPQKGRIIVQLSKHLTCLVDGVINDTYDCSRKEYYDRESGDLMVNEERCVYGYWTAPTEEQQESMEHSKRLVEAQKEAVKQTKTKVSKIKDKYNKLIKAHQKEIRKLKRQMEKEIKKIKESDANAFIDTLLEDTENEVGSKNKVRRFTL